ncbi:ankyrin repeat-containing domain protein [Podospora aff. communis PSN243]|uniref:Ankyrin repeat-containing domain protein n=1 Tax=Podospora aff. communis PSN243 TaxID=3040156 RepID=A0AAV9G8F4_9PEZI|nr:ankyrin repeat-containing domain protein [Podospora aff. communis PSN243]
MRRFESESGLVSADRGPVRWTLQYTDWADHFSLTDSFGYIGHLSPDMGTMFTFNLNSSVFSGIPPTAASKDGVVNVGKSKFTTALYEAADHGWYGITKLLLGTGTDMDAISNDLGLTPLYIAVLRQYKEIVRALLDPGARLTIKDEVGFTTVDMAMQLESYEIAQLLVDAGAKFQPLTINDDDIGQTPEERLFDLVMDGITEEVKYVLRFDGIDPNVVKEIGDITGVTCQHLAAERGHEETVAALLEAGADANSRTRRNDTVTASVDEWSH